MLRLKWVTLKYNLNIGPQLGFMVGSNEIYEQGTGEGIKSTDFGINFGAEAFVSNHIGFSGRYLAGISNIDDLTFESVRSNSMQLSMLVRLN